MADPVTYDDRAAAYRDRNAVERSSNASKCWRAPATRYGGLAVVYRGGAVLAAILARLPTPMRDTS